MTTNKKVLDGAALYFTDNGAVRCGDHCGCTAQYTGRDISGQKVEKITARDVKEAASMGFDLKCEIPSCGRIATMVTL